jgi:hypothetical protein
MTSIRYRLARRRLHSAILATNSDNLASMRSGTPESRFPLFHSHLHHGDTFLFPHLRLRHFQPLSSCLENSATYGFVGLARVLPLPHV